MPSAPKTARAANHESQLAWRRCLDQLLKEFMSCLKLTSLTCIYLHGYYNKEYIIAAQDLLCECSKNASAFSNHRIPYAVPKSTFFRYIGTHCRFRQSRRHSEPHWIYHYILPSMGPGCHGSCRSMSTEPRSRRRCWVFSR